MAPTVTEPRAERVALHEIVRALVAAKQAVFRGRQIEELSAERVRLLAEVRTHVAVARRLGFEPAELIEQALHEEFPCMLRSHRTAARELVLEAAA